MNIKNIYNIRALSGRSDLVLLLMGVLMAIPWHDAFAPTIIKFLSGVSVILTISPGDPIVSEETFQDGSKGPSVRWDVLVHEDGQLKKKVLSVTSKRLNDLMGEMDRKSPISGKTLRITAIGDGLQRTWKVEEVVP